MPRPFCFNAGGRRARRPISGLGFHNRVSRSSVRDITLSGAFGNLDGKVTPIPRSAESIGRHAAGHILERDAGKIPSRIRIGFRIPVKIIARRVHRSTPDDRERPEVVAVFTNPKPNVVIARHERQVAVGIAVLALGVGSAGCPRPDERPPVSSKIGVPNLGAGDGLVGGGFDRPAEEVRLRLDARGWRECKCDQERCAQDAEPKNANAWDQIPSGRMAAGNAS